MLQEEVVAAIPSADGPVLDIFELAREIQTITLPLGGADNAPHLEF
jgi:hypothetical protein